MVRSGIILTADDFGVDKGIDDAVIDLVRRRIIHSVEVFKQKFTRASQI